MKKTIFLIILFFLCAPIANAVDTIADDLSVQGSACIGDTCAADPSPYIGDFGSKITLWVDGSIPQILMRDPDAGDIDFAFLVDDSEFGIYNEDTTTRLLGIDANGIMEAAFEGSTSTGDGSTVIFEISADNQDLSKLSDAGFSIENVKESFEWVFRTSEPTQGFVATKLGTGGAEFRINNDTNVASNVSLNLANGATCNSIGQWLDASSRDYKENIQEITSIEAMKTLKGLQPVKYNFKRDDSKDLNVGFIAEDVPDLVATKDRKALSPLEIVAVLTKVVQEQQALVAKLSERISELEKE